MQKTAIKLIAVLTVLVGLLWARVLYLQKSHFDAAEDYYSQSEMKLALREYDTAMHFYTPFSPYIEKSAGRLWEIGDAFEAGGGPEWALIAYSSIRSSFYASRSFYTPGKSWIEKCDEKIAALNVKLLIDDGSITEKEAAAEKAKHLYVLKEDRAPDILWSAMAIAGFFGWAGSAVFIIFKGFDEGGRRIKSERIVYGAISFGFAFALWVLALLKA